jgi:hypothetical protein
LGAARDVAHGVERKLTPIAAALADLERTIDADHGA